MSIFILIIILIVILFNIESIALKFNLSSRWDDDILSYSLIILTLYLIFIIFISQTKTLYKSNLYGLLMILLIFLILTFSTNSLILFYFFFEVGLIPIFIIIIGWGYQPERLKARMAIFFYTLFASLPLLLIIMNLINIGGLQNMFLYPLVIINRLVKIFWLYKILIFIAFLVKFPIFIVHLWLPKAHVEAPVSGSIILAGVLLKLGGYGIIRIHFIVGRENFISYFLSLSVIGGRLLGIICTLNSDIKVVIAYSSVVHIAIIIVCLFRINSWCVEGGIIVIIAHGVCSSGLFASANLIYERSHSRSYILSGGLLSKLPSFSLFWFLILTCNFGGPFSLNLLGEVILIIGISRIIKLILIAIVFLSFFSAAYRIILYRRTQQGQSYKSSNNISFVEIREVIILISHIWPLFLIPLRCQFI